VHKGEFESLNIQAGDITALTLGSPEGWRSFLDRVAELLDDDHRMTWRAVLWALRGDPDKQHWEQQIDLRRRAVEEVTLARLAGPGDDVITNMAQLLVELVKLTPRATTHCATPTPHKPSHCSPKATNSSPTSPEKPNADAPAAKSTSSDPTTPSTTSNRSTQPRCSALTTRRARSVNEVCGLLRTYVRNSRQ
jgi:hypothetical protein